MAFLDDLGKKITTAAEAVADKTKELAEIAKLSNEIGKSEKRVRSLYEQVGRILFEQEKYNADSPAYQHCVDILAEQQKILELEKKIEAIKSDSGVVAAPAVEESQVTVKPESGERTCPSCGHSESEQEFCTKCGAELVQDGVFIDIK